MDAIEQALEVLELGPAATPQDVKQAYRDLVKIWHPDRFPNDPRVRRKAEEKLKEINKAYEILQGYDPAPGAGSHPSDGPKTSSNPAEDHDKTQAPRAPEFKLRVPLWAYIVGAFLVVRLIVYLAEAPRTEHRPLPIVTGPEFGSSVKEILSNPKFFEIDIEQRKKILSKVDPDFSALPPLCVNNDETPPL
jgi:hypothetical protein